MKRKRSEKGKRMVTTNIKVTEATHQEIKVASEILDKSHSELISMALRSLLPNLTEEVKRFEEVKASARERNIVKSDLN